MGLFDLFRRDRRRGPDLSPIAEKLGLIETCPVCRTRRSRLSEAEVRERLARELPRWLAEHPQPTDPNELRQQLEELARRTDYQCLCESTG